MDYIKVTFYITPDNATNREIFIALISELPFESFTDDSENLDAFIPEKLFNEEEINSFCEDLFIDSKMTFQKIKSINWNEEWEKNYFKPLKVNEQCTIRAPFHGDVPEVKYEIIINPKMAFGTGNHETTLLMMKYLFELDLKNKTVLDMGCGSGILSILSSKLGAKSVTSIDIDQWSFENTLENANLNGIENLEVILGDAKAIPGKKFDVILANIHKNIIIQDLAIYSQHLHLHGNIILSGFYEKDENDVKKEARSNKLIHYNTKSDNNWIAVRHTN